MMEIIIKYFHMFSNTSFQITDMFEIILLSLLLFFGIKIILKTKFKKVLYGLLVFIVLYLLASLFQMTTITWAMKNLLSIALLSVIILFQPELRIALDHFAQYLPKQWLQNHRNVHSGRMIKEITEACQIMSKEKTGALILIEQSIPLSRYCQTGIPLHADVTRQLLVNIFEHNTPLHDGAVVIINNQIEAATCYLPLSSNLHIDKNLGTRHRAGIGATEETDCLCIIVSEETGDISIVKGGIILRMKTKNDLQNYLYRELITEEKTERRWIPFGKENSKK